jgi:hypothetical protein
MNENSGSALEIQVEQLRGCSPKRQDWKASRERPQAPGLSEHTDPRDGPLGPGCTHDPLAAQPSGASGRRVPVGGGEAWREEPRFPTAVSQAQGPEKGRRGGSGRRRRPAPLRPTHRVPSPPAAGKTAAGSRALCGAGRARRAAEEMRERRPLRPLWAALLALGALAGVGVAGEWGSRAPGGGSSGTRAAT